MNLIQNTPYAVLCAGLWALVNGVLHDIFILAKSPKYDRDLLRLLMDGHILITCGLILIFCFKGIAVGSPFALTIAIICCCSLLVYCAMIFPFLKSLVTIAINLFTLTLLILFTIKN